MSAREPKTKNERRPDADIAGLLDPVDELSAVIAETLTANALRLMSSRGGYVGGGQPHATLDNDLGAVEAIARGLLARRVAEPSRAALAATEAPEAVGWHGDDTCAGPDCNEVNEWGDHPKPDPHGPDWYDGYAEAQRERAATEAPAGLDVERVRRTVEAHLAPWFKVPGDDALEEGKLRRCLLCGRLSSIVRADETADVAHEDDCASTELVATLTEPLALRRDERP
jgi:hypothetical protein